MNIIDLTLVAGAFGTTAGAPSMWKLDQDITPARTKWNSGYVKRER